MTMISGQLLPDGQCAPDRAMPCFQGLTGLSGAKGDKGEKGEPNFGTVGERVSQRSLLPAQSRDTWHSIGRRHQMTASRVDQLCSI